MTEEDFVVGTVGDLYSVWLKIPAEKTEEEKLNLLVESDESRRSTRSRMFYSVFDCGHSEKCYSIPAEAWQTYMMMRSDEDVDRKELDTRLWFVAIGDKGQLEDNCTLDHFRKLNLEQLKCIMTKMSPGLTYERPTSREAMLFMRSGTHFVCELLRSEDDEEEKDRVKMNLEGKFNAMDISPSNRVLRSKCKQPCIDLGASVDLEEMPALEESIEIEKSFEELEEEEEKSEDEIFYGVNKDIRDGIKNILAACVNPPDEEIRASRDVWNQVMMAEKLFPRFKSENRHQTEDDAESTDSNSPRAELSYMGDESLTEEGRLKSGEYFVFFVDDVASVQIKDIVDLNQAVREDGGEDEDEGEDVDEVIIDDDEQQVPGGPLNQVEMDEVDMEEDNTVPPPPVGDESLEMTDEEASFIFNDSLEIFFAKPVNESQIFTVESSEDSVTMNGSWGSMMDASTSEEPAKADTQENKFYDEEKTKGN